MKKYLLAIITCNIFFLPILAQHSLIHTRWMGDSLEYIQLDSLEVRFEIQEFSPVQKKYKVIGDTLRLYDRYATSSDNFSEKHTKNYDFLISEKSFTNLSLIPIGKEALDILDGRRLIRYRARHLAKQPLDSFVSVRYRTSTCRGDCPAFLLEITQNKKMNFIGGSHAVKQGFFTAALTDSLFAQLLDALAMAEINKIKSWKQNVQDLPESSIVIHHNGGIKKIQGSFLPSSMNELIQFLLDIPKKVTLVPSASFQIDL